MKKYFLLFSLIIFACHAFPIQISSHRTNGNAVRVRLSISEVLDASGNPRKTSPAKLKETIFYDFNRDNSDLILDIVDAFGIASQQHNEGMRNILGKILETAR
jgi:hypothetical protein